MTDRSVLKTILYALLLGLSVPILLVSFSCTGVSGEYEMATFDFGKNRSIEILASKDAEASQSFYYHVKVDQKVVVPLFMICVGHDRGQLEFKTLIAEDGDVVGIFEQKRPEEMLAIHDFKANATWPGLLSPDSRTEFTLSGTLLLKKLQAEHQHIQLTLADGRACE